MVLGKTHKPDAIFCCPVNEQRRLAVWLFLPLLLLGNLFSQNAAVAQVKQVRKILVLYELGRSSPAVSLLDQQLSMALENSPYQIEIYREYLETALFPDRREQQEIHEWITHKYRDHKLDLIVAYGPSALKFVTEMHERSFRGVPVVFGGTSREEADHPKLDRHFTGVWEWWEPEKTLELALRIKPDTKNVFVIGGTSLFDRHLEAIFKEHLRSYQGILNLSYLVDLDMPTLLDRLGHLPDRSVVLYTHLGQDAKGTRYIGTPQSGPMIVESSNAPVFASTDVDIGYGAVGGNLESFAEEGKIIGRMVLEILGGDKPEDVPIVEGANVYMLDWRALTRWGLNKGGLPPRSVFLNRQPSLWQQGRRYLIPGLLALLAQTIVIVGLLRQRARRRTTEAELRRSEEKFSKSFRQSPLAVILTRLRDSLLLDVSESFEQLTGWSRDEVLQKAVSVFSLCMEANHRNEFAQQLQSQGTVRDLEIFIQRKDGQSRTMLLSAELIEVGGEPCALSVVADITERKLAEEALSTISRKLIEAHEEERSWVARELHDDVNQRLALLAVNLDVLNREIPSSASEAKVHAAEIRHQIKELGIDVQALSHRLHSSKLQYLGLSAAAGAFCREFSEHKGVHIDFHSENIPKSLPEEISLCLFRVLQEALQNAAKHSGSQNYEVSITFESDELRLTVSDSGRGFNRKEALKTPGLGLTSMRERLRIVGGELRIDSRREEGTVVIATVPFEQKSLAMHMHAAKA